RASLSISKMAFCSKIAMFGDFQSLPGDYLFRPGESIKIYAEVKNVSSEPLGSMHRIRVIGTLTIRDLEGRRVLEKRFPEEQQQDISRSKRHDFFCTYYFKLPRNIPQGLYTLQLRVTDAPTERKA